MAYGWECGVHFWDCGCCKSCWPDDPHFADMDEDLCHCGKEIYYELGGFTRDLCLVCSAERCDLVDNPNRFSCED